MKHSIKWRTWVLILAVFTLAFFSISTAFAHELTPLKASPAEGEILAKSPSEVRLTFSEEIMEEGSTLQVFEESGKQVDRGKGGVDLNDAQHSMLVTGLPDLPQGAYLVKWKVTLSDDDASQGQYYFGIGNVVLPKNPTPVPEASSVPRSDPPAALWAGTIVVLLLLVAVILYFVRKARTS